MLIGIDKNRFFNITTNNNDKLDCTFSTIKQKLISTINYLR